MKLTLTGSTITVERELGDPGLHRGGWTPTGWSPESVALGWVMRWLAKEHGVRLVRTTARRDYERHLSCHLVDNDLPLLRQPVAQYGNGGPWDVHILNANYAIQSVEDNWRERRPIVFRVFKASAGATFGEEP